MFLRSILVMLGVACGGLATIAFYLLFHSSAPTPQAIAKPAPPPPTLVVVAAKPISTGTLIKLQDLRFAPVTDKQPTAGDFVRVVMPTPGEQAVSDRRIFNEIAEAVSRTRFEEGAPILRDAIVKPGDAGFLAAVLRPGKRAVTLSVNRVTGAAGLLYPADHVDVVLTQVFPGHELDPGNRTVSETIVTDLRVVAVDHQLQAGNQQKGSGQPAQTVTLEVSAVQAEQIDVGAKMGELSLTIRGVGDDVADDRTLPDGIWAKDVSPAAARMRAPAPIPVVKPGKREQTGEGRPKLSVYRGDKVENVAVP